MTLILILFAQLLNIWLRFNLWRPDFQNFPGGSCPQTPLRSLTRVPYVLKICMPRKTTPLSNWDVQGMSVDEHPMPPPHVLVSVDDTVTGMSRECPWTNTLCLHSIPSIRGWHSNWDVQGMSVDEHPMPPPHILVSVDGTVTGTSRKCPWTNTLCLHPMS